MSGRDDNPVALADLLALQQASLATLSVIASQLTYLLTSHWAANPLGPGATIAREVADRARAVVAANDALLDALTAPTGEFRPPPVG